MAKETKNLLTREDCKKELLRSTKFNIRIFTIFLFFSLLLCVPLIIAVASLLKHLLVIAIIIILFLCAMPCFFVVALTCAIIELMLINKGGFSIVKDTVYHLVHNEEVSRRGSKIYVDAIYFSKYGRYVASSTTFGLASVGDEFYLVILHAKGKTISLAYNSLMYDCKEVDNLL